MERRLAAVMIADVVGYGRLSQVDEEGTRARFQANLKDIFEPKIAAHHGRLVKTMGDGILVEFQSVINALRCAVDIQRAEGELNAGAPADERLEFRIAINLGDVIVEGDDIHGNGVNIADRLQALARPGGVVISGTAYDQVTNRLDVGYEFLGEQRMKNIAEPVRVYGVLTGLTSPAPAAAPRAGKAAARRWLWPAVAAAVVIAVARRGGLVAAMGAFPAAAGRAGRLRGGGASGRASRLRRAGRLGASVDRRRRPPKSRRSSCSRSTIFPTTRSRAISPTASPRISTTELARIPGLFVISRNAAFTYKGKAMQPAVIAKELGVRYLLEGSIRRVGDDIRINAQLIDGESSGHMWAERFDGAWSRRFRAAGRDGRADRHRAQAAAGRKPARRPDRRGHEQSCRL